MCAELIPLARVALDEAEERPVAVHDGRVVARRIFSSEVAGLSAALAGQPQQHFALYDEAAYPFALALFALLHAGKRVWIPGNNRPATAERLMARGCRLLGVWPGQETGIGRAGIKYVSGGMKALDLNRSQLIIFTSGSSGEPKTIEKSLSQLQNEVTALERQWGAKLGCAAAVATVSHQHIYGLLFRLLWPLAAGRPFFSQLFLSPEPMFNALSGRKAYWVASPAQLKRLDQLSPWKEIGELAALFSSGGPLPGEAAERIERLGGRETIEIYGSSETGGIGWRHSPGERFWRPFAGIQLTQDDRGRCRLSSPYLPEPRSCSLDDRLVLYDDGRFTLAGRVDRIVKVEEKRLSLDQLERTLQQLDWIEQAHCLLLAGERERIAAQLVLGEDGEKALLRHGRKALIRRLRRHLMETFETVVLPRKWLFVDSMPLTAQGKVDTALLSQLWRLEPGKFPQLLFCRRSANRVVLEVRVRTGLAYFDGHFPGQPILPGVAQLAWVEAYGKLFFAIDRPFLTMEVIKFKKIIQPGALLTMTLEWKDETGKLYFEIHSATASHSSGRMVYGERG